MHPGDGKLQALIDGELDNRQARGILAHLGTCEACRARREALERELDETAGLLGSLDRETPAVAVEAVVQEAERRRLARKPARRRTLLAASLAGLLVAGAVAAAIVPGSPVRGWVGRIMNGPEAGTAPGDTAPDPWGQEAGVGWIPQDGLELRFEMAQTEGSIELIETAGDTARVEMRGDSVGFVVGDGSVLVQNRGSRASYRVAVPAGLPDVRIRVGSHTVYEMTEGRILVDESRDRGGVRRIPLSARAFPRAED